MLTLYFLLLSAISASCSEFNVLHYGAVGDGKTVDSDAVRRAFAECASNGGGTVRFPANHIYITGPFNISSNTLVLIESNATIAGNPDHSDWPIIEPLPWMGGGSDFYGDYGRPDTMALVHSHGASNITIMGGGTIDGQGDVPDPLYMHSWIDCMRHQNLRPTVCANASRPHLILLYMGHDLTIYNVTIRESPNWTLHIANFTGVHIYNITIFNPAGFNRDGIDIDCSSNVLVEKSLINAGDDALCVKSGEDWIGRHVAIASRNITFRDIHVGTGHGITIGSDMSAGVSNVLFERISMESTEIGIRMKSQRGRGGLVRNVTYRDITMRKIIGPAIQITLNYHAGIAPTNASATPIFSDVLIENVDAQDVGYIGFYDGLPEQHLLNVTLRNVTIQSKHIFPKCDYVNGVCEGKVNACPPCFTKNAESGVLLI